MSSNNYRFRGINLTSSVVTNLSLVAGATVTNALNNLFASNPGRSFENIGITAIPDSVVPLIISTAPFSTTDSDPNVQVLFTASVEAVAVGPIIANYEIQVDGVPLAGSQRIFSVGGFGGGSEFRTWATQGVVNLLAPGNHVANLVVTSATVAVGDSLSINPTGILTVSRW